MRSPFWSPKYTALLKRLSPSLMVTAALLLIWCVGIFGRGFWTPDEPREADIAWRMSWQPDRTVPLLAGEAFCEKPPLTYWLAAIPIRLFGAEAWAARLPNLLYALITALGAASLARRSVGRMAGLIGASVISTFLLSYQVSIWLATDAPLLAAMSIAVLGAYRGFYAVQSRERVYGYTLMHAAMACGFLSKSAVAWMVPATTLICLAVWEKRWREFLRWELYLGLALQAAMILTWVWFVYMGSDGPAHLKVFFWNNLVGRFTQVDAPNELQYAAAHRNSPGKYLLELPLYLAPWTLLVVAAVRRAWRQRKAPLTDTRPVRFALAASLPSLLILSLSATARNVYLAPALPGAALLLAWWAGDIVKGPDKWDVRAMRATAALLLLGVGVFTAALAAVGADDWNTMNSHATFVLFPAAGLVIATALALIAWAAASHRVLRAQVCLFLAYCTLLVGPASQVYARVDTWQNLPSIARAIRHDAAGRPMILLAPDETTRAMIDMYARTDVDLIPGPIDSGAIGRLASDLRVAPQSVVVVQLPAPPARIGHRLLPQSPPQLGSQLPWLPRTSLKIAERYALPNGRSYALLEFQP
jgi:4-amino-4-deoxy-L-arabinose transferase-like glycosyltransferase